MTADDELIERIARTLCDNNGDDPDDMELYRGDARTIMPVIAAEVQAARADAWNECARAAYTPEGRITHGPNPYETGGQA